MLRDTHLSSLWPVLAALIAISLWFGVKAGGDSLLKNRTVAPNGLGSLERAGSIHRARAIIDSWNRVVPVRRTDEEIKRQSFLASVISNEGRPLTQVARRSLVFDLFFILFYTSAMAVACLLAATQIAVRRPREGSRLVAVGIRLAYAQVITGAFDVLENLALWRMLSGSESSVWAVFAYGCSIAKYFLISVSLLYVLIAFVFWIMDHRKQPKTTPVVPTTA